MLFVILMNVLLHLATGRMLISQDRKLIEQREEYVRIQNNILSNRIIYEGIDQFSLSGDYSDDADMVSELQLMANGIEGRIAPL